MKTAHEILQDATHENFTYVDYRNGKPFDVSIEEPDAAPPVLTLHPGLNEVQLAELERQLPAPIPIEIRNLLLSCSDFDLYPDVSFTDYNTWPYGHVLAHVMVLANDGCGNHWVIEVDPISGKWEHVWYGCHDPCNLTYQCETLSEFIEGILDFSRFEKCEMGHRSILEQKPAECEAQVVSRIRESRMDDDVLSSFVSGLNDNYAVVDLRNAKAGDCFNVWGISQDQPIKRHDHELLFAYRKKTTFWQRLFGGRGK